MAADQSPPQTPFDPTALDPRDMATLVKIMQALRTPVTGCPWDLDQTFETIAPYTIEEAYEVADAIHNGTRADLCEELGDLLLQPVYHAQLAAEEGAFTFADVIEAVVKKMIRRHPHVFGDDKARSATLAKGFWDEMKAKEKAGQPAKEGSLLDSVPLALPGLTRALKLQEKAAKVGFDWPSVDNVYDKIAEEIAELRAAPPEKMAGELGDILFGLANVARHMGIDPEEAVRQTNKKFTRRFAFIERELAKAGRKPADSNLAEMDALWDKAKAAE
jgi:MazG family protein